MAGLGIVNNNKTVITKELLIERFPEKAKTITDEVVELINKANNDPEFNGDEFLDAMVTYRSIMQKNSASMKDYVRALKFCAYLESTNDNYVQAYIKARNDDEFVKARMNLPTNSIGYKELASAASRYRKTSLVIQILTQTEMPLRLMFRGARYEAIGVLINEMHNAKYSRDRINAAKVVLETLKDPDNMTIELDIGVKENSAVEQLNNQLLEFANTSIKQLENGITDLNRLGSMKINTTNVIDAEIKDGRK